MKITKSDFYLNLKNIFGNSCGFLIHGISDNPDFATEFSSLPNEEIANIIMQEGLHNNYHNTITRTCFPFGRLSDYSKTKSSRFMNYTPYKSEGLKTNILLAIPTCFIDKENNKYFGGWIDYSDYNYRDSYNSALDCVLHGKKIIPREFILGYYTLTYDSNEIDFHLNPNHYYFLTKEQQTEFINNLNKPRVMFNIENDYDEYYASRLNLVYGSLGDNFLRQFKQFKSENSKIITNLDYDSFKFIKYPNFETVMNGEVDIRGELINHDFDDFCILNETGFNYNNPDLKGQEIQSEYFEEWIKSVGADPVKSYKYVYDNYKEEVLQIYYKKLQELTDGQDAPSI